MAKFPKYFYFKIHNNGVNVEIEDASDADVVEVVRCADCKFAHLTASGDAKYCDQWEENGDALYLPGNFYCAYGERKR